MPIIPSLALPVEQFDDFRHFAEVASGLPAELAAAAEMALSVRHALGLPSIGSGPAQIEALAEWLRIHGTEEWRQARTAIHKLPVAPPEDHLSFTFDDGSGLRGLDEAPWAPTRYVLQQLDEWCEAALRAYRATLASTIVPRPQFQIRVGWAYGRPVSPGTGWRHCPTSQIAVDPNGAPAAPPPPLSPRDQYLIEAWRRGVRPGTTISWTEFCDEVMKACGVAPIKGKPPRGFGIRWLQTRIKQLRAQGLL